LQGVGVSRRTPRPLASRESLPPRRGGEARPASSFETTPGGHSWLYRGFIGALALAAGLGIATLGARASDNAMYPDWAGAWRGIGGSSCDTSKPKGLAQETPLAAAQTMLVIEQIEVDPLPGSAPIVARMEGAAAAARVEAPACIDRQRLRKGCAERAGAEAFPVRAPSSERITTDWTPARPPAPACLRAM
jgi:hypothetical protein